MAGYYDRDRNPRVNDGGSTQGERASTFSAAGTMNHPITHHGNTAEYMASGFPYVLYLDGNITDAKISFPFVTQWVCISGKSDRVAIAFKASASNDITGNAMKFIIEKSEESQPPVFRWKCTDIYVTGEDISIAAGMTNVPRENFPDISEIEGVKTATVNGSVVTP